MKYALIGCGRISPNHIVAAQKNDLEIVAICDIVPENMQDKAEKFGLENVRQYTDYQELLAVEKPELAAICTESGKHAEVAIDCIKAGCHVIIEKPIALSIEDADRIVQLSKQYHVKVCASHQNRFNKSIQKIREAVEQERFGKMWRTTYYWEWALRFQKPMSLPVSSLSLVDVSQDVSFQSLLQSHICLPAIMFT